MDTALTEFLAESPAFFAGALAQSQTWHCFVAGLDGLLFACNAAAAHRLGQHRADLKGRALGDYLTEPDALTLREMVESGGQSRAGSFLLNFVDAGHDPYTLACRLEVRSGYFVLLGEIIVHEELLRHNELQDLNNQLAALARENERKTKELTHAKALLESTLQELRNSHWHLRKVAEALPMCITCGRVRPDEAQWQDVTEFFTTNSLLVTHGCCPECEGKMRGEWGEK